MWRKLPNKDKEKYKKLIINGSWRKEPNLPDDVTNPYQYSTT